MEQGLRVDPTKVRELGHVPTSSYCSLAEGCALGLVNSPVLWPPMGEQSEPLGIEKFLGKKKKMQMPVEGSRECGWDTYKICYN